MLYTLVFEFILFSFGVAAENTTRPLFQGPLTSVYLVKKGFDMSRSRSGEDSEPTYSSSRSESR